MIDTNSMTWSWSRINSFPDEKDGCGLAWKKTYIEKRRDEGEQNAFSEWGTLGHELYKDYFEGKLLAFELPDEFKKRVRWCLYNFPFKNLKEKNYNLIVEHFSDLSWLDDFEILAFEQEKRFEYKGYNFTSISDLEVKNIHTGEIGIIDHKISNQYYGKDLEKKIRQLYLYSRPFEMKYGKLPDFIGYNFFKFSDGKNLKIVKFDKEKYDVTWNWIIETIEKISKADTIELGLNSSCSANIKDFFGQFLCNYRNCCECRKIENIEI